MIKIHIVCLFCLASSILSYSQDTVYLREPGSRPWIVVYKPKSSVSGTAVIICSGGSYGRTADVEEGIPAAKYLASGGVTSFLLDYRLPFGVDTVPVSDAQLAIQYVREHAIQFRLKKDRIGIMGFSAGGHLVSTAGTHFMKNYIENPKHTSLRPDFMILVYPVISFEDGLTHLRSRSNLLGPDIAEAKIFAYSNQFHVTKKTPPTFMVHAIDDDDVKVSNSLYFEAALCQHHVPVQMFLYAHGGHGFGIHNGASQVQWIDECTDWIKKFSGEVGPIRKITYER